MSSLFNIAAGGQAGGFYDYQIEQSLRFDESSQAYLRKTDFSGSPTSDQTGTFSVWVKNTLSYSDNRNAIYGSATGNNGFVSLSISGGSQNIDLRTRNNSATDLIDLITDTVYRDPSAWYHIMSVYDLTDSTQSDRAQIYVNGVRVTNLGTNTLPNNTTTTYDSGDFLTDMQIGRTNTNSSNMIYADFILAEYHRVDGQALDPTDFGEFKSGVWVPKEYTGTYGNHGFHLDFADTSDIGKDVSGNSNNFTANNLSAHDVVPDSPTLNYATANVLAKGGNLTLSEGNLRVNATSATVNSSVPSTIGMTTGKWYAEYYIQHANTSNARSRVGISSVRYLAGSTTEGQNLIDNGSTVVVDGESTWRIYENGTLIENSGNVAVGDIIGIAFDADAQTVEFYLNGVKLGTSTPYDVASVGDGIYYFAATQRTSADGIFNFGQDSTFAGATTAGGNSDANGYGDFKYSVPSGYLALNSANLPEPDITPLDDDLPEGYFNTVLYTGNGTADREVTGVGFQPDFSWFKARSTTNSHNLTDSVRGAGLTLASQSTAAENDESAYITSFTSDGIQLGLVGGNTNTNNATYVVWNWLAGGTAVSNTDGSITSSVSANTEAGFSIVSYASSGSAATVGHGLNSVPEMIIAKRRDASGAWSVYHVDIGNDRRLQLSETLASSDSATWGDTTPTSTVFTQDVTGAVGGTIIAYCFHSVEGYSKIGSYSGNSSNDGTFVYTGFRPAFVMTKVSSGGTGGWIMQDTTRSVNNQMTDYLLANTSGAEQTGIDIDLLSNGFKWRAASSSSTLNHNTSGDNYIYMAFAEMPFKYANAR